MAAAAADTLGVVSPRTRRLLVIVVGVVVAWYAATVLLWAVKPLHDAVPSGNNTHDQPSSTVVHCNTLFDGDALSNAPLPTPEPPQQFTREPCGLVHRDAQRVFAIDTAVFALTLAGAGVFVLRRRRHAASDDTDRSPVAV